jgi:hypothetical protein
MIRSNINSCGRRARWTRTRRSTIRTLDPVIQSGERYSNRAWHRFGRGDRTIRTPRFTSRRCQGIRGNSWAAAPIPRHRLIMAKSDYRNLEAYRAARRRYRQSPAGKATKRRYERSVSGKASANRKSRNRLKRDASYRLRRNLSTAIRQSLRRQKWLKANRLGSLLGCSIESFQIYIESRFQIGMTWENYGSGDGKWNIDHIIPCSLFDLTKKSHQQVCFHFSNHQPLWHSENMMKSNKITEDRQMNLPV